MSLPQRDLWPHVRLAETGKTILFASSDIQKSWAWPIESWSCGKGVSPRSWSAPLPRRIAFCGLLTRWARRLSMNASIQIVRRFGVQLVLLVLVLAGFCVLVPDFAGLRNMRGLILS